MKSRKTFKKVLPLLGVGALVAAGVGIGTSTIEKSAQQTIKQAAKQATRTISVYSSTINGQQIVNAINSFKNNPSINNTNQAYNFYYYSGETAATALIKNIKENIKYVKYYDSSKVYTLPDSAIQIVPTSQYGNYNVQIDLTQVDGLVVYYNYFNPSTNDTDHSEINNDESNIVVESRMIQFNAVSYNNVNEAKLQSVNSMDPILIISIAAGVVGGIGILLLLLLLIKRKMSNKYSY